jgi:hypothetical protein
MMIGEKLHENLDETQIQKLFARGASGTETEGDES